MTIICLFLLSSLGLALTVQARGCERPVLGPNMSLKGTDILLKEFPDGTKVGFTCNDGYIPRGGPTTSTCTNGEWSAMAMQCEKKNCGSLGEVPNGDIDYSEGTEFGNTAVVTCQLGYTLVGSSRIHCGNEGWMNRLPNCEVVACETPAQITDGTFSPEKENYEYREVIHYTCRKDFTLSGSVSRMCSENGSFSPEAPVCTNVQCAKPDVKNANRVGGFKAVYMYKEVVEHECQPKYTMSGKSTSVCDINGKWTPALLKCEESGGSSKTRDWVIGVVVAFRKALLKMRPREGKESLCRSRVVKETDNRAHSNFCTPVSAAVLWVQHYWM
ncbi:C4b-binding protein alpha chain-like isoform X11 [Notolabrus celidotus]|uniref:C4b-binding protein alpha chain-like isoform X11 n=1 Tax=Notolabrus celidotus TaxID=1203425 RepID=UPI00148FA24D|nr:C4b-binding protein alpha chain-like isoform X11 [Notolabrus celidotus]